MAANGGAMALCAEDNTGTKVGTSGSFASMPNCSSVSYDWGVFSDSLPDGSAGGVNQTSITGNKDGTMSIYAVNGIKMLSTVDMQSHKISNLSAGSVASGSGDAVNGGELFNTANSVASALGSSLGANGVLSAPSFVLSNANTIVGTTGAATDVTTAFGKVDAALGTVNSSINGGGIKYFHVNSAAADSQASGQESIAIGSTAQATTDNSIAIGRASSTDSNDGDGAAVAVGSQSHANGDGVAIGQNTDAAGSRSVAVGPYAAVSGRSGIAMGSGSSAQGDYSTAVGPGAKTSGTNAVALGNTSNAAGNRAISIGSGSSVDVNADSSIALGRVSSATASDAVALGYQSLADRATTVSVGNATKQRQIVNMAAGTQGTDAVNVSQLSPLVTAMGGGAAFNSTTGAVTGPSYALTNANGIGGTSGAATDVGTGFSKVDSALGTLNTSITNINNGGGIKYFHTNSSLADSSATGANAIAVGGAATADGANGLAMGTSAHAGGAGDVAIGQGASALNNGGAGNNAANAAVALGYNATASAGDSAAVGTGSQASANYSSAFGANANASGVQATSVGSTSAASGLIATALGYGANAAGDRSVALGSQASVAAGTNLSMALGRQSKTTANNAVAVGAGSVADRDNTISVGSAGAERQIVNMAKGVQSTDAVNVSQLSPLVTAMGGGATFNSTTGAVTGPSYALTNANTIGGTTGAATDVGSGFGKVDTALGNLNTTVNNISNGVGIKYYHVNSSAADSTATGLNSTAIGPNAQTNAYYGLAIGTNASANVSGTTGVNNGWTTAVGPGAVASNHAALALGSQTTASGYGAAALGAKSIASGDNSAAVGLFANASAINSVALGASSTTTADLTQLGYNPGNGPLKGAASTANGEVSIGASNKERRLTNLAAGSADTDAVNVSQLKSENAKADQLGATTASALGGTATYSSSTGAISAPSYLLTNANSIGGTSGAATDVGTGFGKVDAALGVLNTGMTGNTTSINSLQTTVNNLTNGVGIKYFHANSGADDSQAFGYEGVAIGGGAVAGVAGSANVTQRAVTIGSGAHATIQDSIAVGTNASTVSGFYPNANNMIAIGTNAVAGYGHTIALGGNAKVNVNSDGSNGLGYSVGIGDSVTVADVHSTAVGALANTTGAGSTALGYSTTATGNATAVGVQANASGAGAVALGQGAAAAGAANIAMGQNANATGANNAIAIGGDSKTGDRSVALGNGADTSGTSWGVAVGTSAKSTGQYGVSLGAGTLASGAQSVALGTNSVADRDLTVSVGSSSSKRQVVNMAAGVQNTDAVNVSQLKPLVIAMGGGATFNSTTGAVTGPSYALTNANTIAGTSGAATDVGTGFGKVDDALGKLNTSVTQNTSDIAGNTASINDLDSRVTTNEGDITNVTNQLNSGTIGLVQQSAAGENLTVGKDTDGAAVDFLGTAGARKLINVADGTVAAGSKDAVNGGQLFGVSQSVADAIGGGSVVNPDGSISGPSYDVHNADGSTTTVTNMGDAITNIDGRTTQNTTDIAGNTTSITNLQGDVSNITNNINSGTIGLVQQSAAGANLTVGKDTDGAAVDFLGTAGARKLINVADGTVAAGSKDAVNGGQLFTTNQQVAQNTTDIAGNAASITNLDNRTTTNEGDISTLNTAITSMAGVMGDAVMYDSAAHTKVTLGTAGTPVQLTNVKDGALAAGSTDAVNGSQLFTTNQQVAQNTTDIAGNTTSISNLDGRVTNVEGDITNISNQISTGEIGLVQQSAAGANLTVGKDTDGAAVDFKGTAGARKLINVADGTVAAGSKDAVNGGQLFGVSQSVADAIGGGSVVNPDGSISGPSYDVHNADGSTTTVTNMGDAITNIDGRTTQNTTDIAGNTTSITNLQGDVSNITNNINSGTIGLVQQSAAGANLTVGKDTDGAAVDFLGTAGARKLINVADGTVASDSKEAVNGSQLFATNQAVAQNTTDISNLDGRVTTNEGDITNLDARVTTNEGDISTLNTNVSNIDARVTQNTTDIAGNTTSITNLQGDVSNITNNINSGTIGLVQQSAAGENLTVGKDTDGAAVDFLGTAGARKLINVADGTVAAGSKDAVNGGQLFGVSQSVSDAIGGGSVVNPDGSISGPSYDVHNADGSTTVVHNMGDAITNIDGRVTQNTTEITNLDGRMTNVEGDVTNISTQINSGTIGLVQQSAAGENLTVGKDTDGAAVDFLGTAGARKLINVADGTVAAGSKDAVNGGQLFGVSQSVANAIGGGSTVNADGSISGPSYNVTNADGSTTTVTNMGDAITNIDGRVTQNTTEITNLDGRVTTNEGDISTLNTNVSNIDARVTNSETSITNLDGRMTNVEGDVTNISTQINSGTIGLVQQSAAGENLTVGKDTDGAAVDFLGTAGARKLINVADGTVASDSKEAVNGSQLFTTNQAVAQNTTDISNLDGRVTNNETDISNLDGRVTNNETSITNLDGRMTTSETNISNLDNRVTNNEGSITNLDGRMTNVEGDVTNISTQINSGTIGLVQQSAAGENLTVGKDTDGEAVDFLGTAGARKLINVADGTVAAGSKDAVNGGQLFGVSQSVANAIGGGSVVNGDGSISGPSYNVTNADGSTTVVHNMGDAITNIDGRVTQNSTDINNINTTINTMSGVMGDAVMYDTAAHDKVTLGSKGKAVQLTNIAAGELSADSTDAVNGSQLFDTNNKVAVIDGRVTNLEGSVSNIVNGGGIKYVHTNSTKADSTATGANSIAIGGAANASASGAVALGDNAQASGKGSVALGQDASDGGRGAEAAYVGKYSGANNDNVVGTVSVGNAATGETRTISNVADATQATDAVNLRQLDGAVAQSKAYTDSKVDGIASQLDGSIADVDKRVTKVEGDVSGLQNGTDGMAQVNNASHLPKPKATGTDSVAVGAGAESAGANSTAMGTNAKAKGKNSVAIGANSVAERDNSVAVGSEGNERQITHVAAGTERTDAANVGQLSDALNDIASQSNAQYNDLKHDLHEQDDRLSAGIAGAIAIASLPQPMVNGGSTTSVGVGNFNGQSALSVGVSHTTNDGKWTAKIGGSVDSQSSFSIGAGVGYNW
ncbi:YadA-like family protein [Pseudomonas sp. PDNC002]|uniref:YadA-like family protein n=1 Tax=Pseudomonas sp. PDNC002 TaxID=2811422 RepID=UPI001F066BE0|nr:YadA-like family protein [Pseudomonas sp. PDNC002]